MIGHQRRRRRYNEAESTRLRPLFLAWVGRRSNAAGLKAAGIPYYAGAKWLGGGVLPDDLQAKVRLALGDAAGAP